MLALLLGVMLFVAGFALGALSNRYEVSGAGGARGVRFMRVDKWTGQAWELESERWEPIVQPKR